MPQRALRALQAVHHHGLALQGLDEHAVLYGLLKRALHARVFRAHVLGQLAHAVDIDLAEPHEHGDDGHGDERQHRVHGEEIAKRSDKHGNHRQRARNGLGEETHDVGHVKFQAVEHVARMVMLPAVPLRAKNAVEHALLHAVLRAYAENVLHPRAADAQQEVAKNQYAHYGHGPIEISTLCATRHVDGMAHGGDLCKRHHDRQQANRGIEARLQAVATPGMPKPVKNVQGIVLGIARLESLIEESRHDSSQLNNIIPVGRLPT